MNVGSPHLCGLSSSLRYNLRPGKPPDADADCRGVAGATDPALAKRTMPQRATQLYERGWDEVSLDEIERIVI
jgi:hypothetical protein